ncbi:MAG: LysR family transcriptional regulator [Deltaproteobacteria bacterium]|nr:LysR family transcriptional regulator [Deltaproteobacteria bacterium]
MDFEQIRIFMVLAEERTFLGAANRLDTSRSRVRRKLDQLEQAAGTTLLAREASGLTLTPAGEVLVRRGRALLIEAELLISQVCEVGNSPTGRLRIGLPLGPPSSVCLDACADLQTRWPQLELEICFAARPTSLLPERVELVLTYEETIEKGNQVIELGEVPMRLFAGAGYLDQHGWPETLEDLDLQQLACWRRNATSPTTIPLAGGRTLSVAPRAWSEDPALLHRLAGERGYLAYSPDLLALRSPSVRALLVDEVRGVVRARLVIPEVLVDRPRVRAFVDLCQLAKTVDPVPVA